MIWSQYHSGNCQIVRKLSQLELIAQAAESHCSSGALDSCVYYGSKLCLHYAPSESILLQYIVLQSSCLLITDVALKGNWKLIHADVFFVTVFRFNCLCYHSRSFQTICWDSKRNSYRWLFWLFLTLCLPWWSHKFRTHEVVMLL